VPSPADFKSGALKETGLFRSTPRLPS
jgi:hypothetical protein